MRETLIAKQFTPIYDEKEDRIRLIINLNYPTRYDVWITRRFLVMIVDELSELFDKEVEKQEPFISSEKNKIEDGQKVYTFEKEPNLLENLHIRFDKKKSIYYLKLSDKSVDIETNLTPEELKKLVKYLIEQVKYKWGINFF